MGFKLTRGQSAPDHNSVVVASNGTPSELVSGALDALGGIDGFVGPGDVVLVKPNASFAYGPERATNTSPEVASAVASLCFQAGASRVIFADNILMKPASVALAANGLREAVEGCGAEFIVLGERADFEPVEVEGSSVLRRVDVAKLCGESDVIINLPVMKHHSSTGSTISMKNLMGLVHDRSAFHRKGLHECIAELSLAVRPDLTIVDATRALMSNGPRGPGDVVEFGKVVAGADPVAVDVASLALGSSMGYGEFGLDGVRNRYVDIAASLGIGDGDPESVAAKTFELDVAGGGGDMVTPGEETEGMGRAKTPVWAPYASLSAASIALGLAALLYSRRKARVAQEERG